MIRSSRVWICGILLAVLAVVLVTDQILKNSAIGKDISQTLWGLNILHYSKILEKLSRSNQQALEREILQARGEDLLPEPVLSHASGFYPGGLSLTITLPVNTQAYYTLDGSIPTRGDILVDGPIQLSNSTALRVRAFNGSASSDAVNATYIVEQPPQATVVAIVMDPVHLFDKHSGIYSNPNQTGRGWERPADITFLDPLLNARLQAEVRVRIHGGASRGLPNQGRKNFRVYVGREEADLRAWMSYPETIAVHQSQWVLRHVPVENQLWSDRFAQRLARQLGIAVSSARPMVLYLNGVRWGVYDLMERINKAFLAGKEAGPKFDLLRGSVLINPDKANPRFASWNSLYREIADSDLKDPRQYARVAAKFDIDRLIDYYALSIFLADSDRPHHNIDLYRSRKSEPEEPGQWKFAAWDFDHGLNYRGRYATVDSLAWHLRSQPRPDLKLSGSPDTSNMVTSTTLLRSLMQNPEFRTRFVRRFHELLATTFSPDNLRRTFQAVLEDYAGVIELERERFENQQYWLLENIVKARITPTGYTYDHRMQEIYDFLDIRTKVIERALIEHFGPLPEQGTQGQSSRLFDHYSG